MPVMLQSRYGIKIGAKKCQRLKKKLGLRSLYPHRDTSKPNPRAEKEPYLLKDMKINEVDQVWTSDITCIQIEQRNYYLCVVMDWDSRFVLGWSMGRNMDVSLCLRALEMALSSGRPPLFSIPTRAVSIQRRNGRKPYGQRGYKSAWTGKGAGPITSSWKDSGEHTNMSFSCIESQGIWTKPMR